MHSIKSLYLTIFFLYKGHQTKMDNQIAEMNSKLAKLEQLSNSIVSNTTQQQNSNLLTRIMRHLTGNFCS